MIDFISYNTLIVLLGTSLLGANAGLVGTFAVLRRRALVGDALAHATLPGLCFAVLAIGGRNLPAMLCRRTGDRDCWACWRSRHCEVGPGSKKTPRWASS